jgi:hypothetical protein
MLGFSVIQSKPALNQVSLALRRIESGQAVIRDEVISIATQLRTHLGREELANIGAWLCPPASFTAQESLEAALRTRHQGTGNWFLNSGDFLGWSTPHEIGNLLWITGLRKTL